MCQAPAVASSQTPTCHMGPCWAHVCRPNPCVPSHARAPAATSSAAPTLWPLRADPGRVVPMANYLRKLSTAPAAGQYCWKLSESPFVLDPTNQQGSLMEPVPLFEAAPSLLPMLAVPPTLCLINEPPPGRDVNVDTYEQGVALTFVTNRDVQAGEELYLDCAPPPPASDLSLLSFLPSFHCRLHSRPMSRPARCSVRERTLRWQMVETTTAPVTAVPLDDVSLLACVWHWAAPELYTQTGTCPCTCACTCACACTCRVLQNLLISVFARSPFSPAPAGVPEGPTPSTDPSTFSLLLSCDEPATS